ncbi:MAG: hypothetical protein V4568_17930 [Pseudomonadota bacterium]
MTKTKMTIEVSEELYMRILHLAQSLSNSDMAQGNRTRFTKEAAACLAISEGLPELERLYDPQLNA